MRISALFLSVLLALGVAILPQISRADVSVSLDFSAPVAVAPPPLPVYAVPAPPADDYVWWPGHWQWDGYGYFWIPGSWVLPPVAGVLWTPGYWGWNGDAYIWHEGYWGPHVGFYGGINYGGGYDGVGFKGGHWNNGHYIVNRSALSMGRVARADEASFNGGPGGTKATPTPEERSFEHENHLPPTAEQRGHIKSAINNETMRAVTNHGAPSIATTSRAGDFAHGQPAQQAGPRNMMAEQHEAAVRHNPDMAKGAAMPREYPHASPAEPHNDAPHGQDNAR